MVLQAVLKSVELHEHADLDLHCFLKRVYPGSAGARIKYNLNNVKNAKICQSLSPSKPSYEEKTHKNHT